ncbi:MAG: twin-arginine translocation signal domain-containing protein [Planctomycetaceae bacterium]
MLEIPSSRDYSEINHIHDGRYFASSRACDERPLMHSLAQTRFFTPSEEQMNPQSSRRDFIKTTGTAAALAAGAQLYATAPARAAGANDKLRIAFIGPGGRGFGACENSGPDQKRRGPHRTVRGCGSLQRTTR